MSLQKEFTVMQIDKYFLHVKLFRLEGRKGVNYCVTTGDMRTLSYKGTDEEHDGWLNDAIVCAFMQYIIKQSVCNNGLNTMGKKNIYLFTYLFTLHINDVNCDFN